MIGNLNVIMTSVSVGALLSNVGLYFHDRAAPSAASSGPASGAAEAGGGVAGNGVAHGRGARGSA